MGVQASADLDTAVARVLDALVETAGVGRAGLALVEGTGRRLCFTATDSEILAVPGRPAQLRWCDIDAYDDVPLTAVVRTGDAVLGSVEVLADRFPDFAQDQSDRGVVAVAALPLGTGAATWGGVVLFYELPQQFGPRQQAQLQVSAARAAAQISAVQALSPAPEPSRERPEEGEDTVSLSVDPVPISVALARRFARRQLQEWKIDDDLVDTAVLCLSELVTNVVMHASSPARIKLGLRGERLTVSVRDAGRGRQVATAGSEPDPLLVDGRGLRVVAALSEDWGSHADDSGTTVWCLFST